MLWPGMPGDPPGPSKSFLTWPLKSGSTSCNSTSYLSCCELHLHIQLSFLLGSSSIQFYKLLSSQILTRAYPLLELFCLFL